MIVVPQQYKLQYVQSGIDRTFRWYYVYNSQSSSIEFNCLTQNFGYSCSSESQTIHSINNTIVHNLTVTWYAEKISSVIFSQSNNNGDHIHRCYEKVEIKRNRYLRVTGNYFYYEFLQSVGYFLIDHTSCFVSDKMASFNRINRPLSLSLCLSVSQNDIEYIYCANVFVCVCVREREREREINVFSIIVVLKFN